ncbi:hypothetical protein ABIA99_007561 [Bradyrhizobium sp. LB12.1]|uniref:methionyl-tRNA formyltransferase-like protein n=1 Tax=Bradyrhizobium sp. LB12.1 TaxID=3156327 RepID=UPI003395A2DF
MNLLSNLLASATAEIGREYFRLPIHGGGPVYRERVYCYELYHQMRRRWPDDGPYRLNGEVDKAAHPVLSRLDASYAKPDLLVHGPGDMGRNHAIIEVKSQKATAEGIEKDIRTLSLFRRRVGYERAIYLIYGHGNLERIFQRINRLAAEVPELPTIEVWAHHAQGRPAVHLFDLYRP